MLEPLSTRFLTSDGRPCGYGVSVFFGSWQGEPIEWTVLGSRAEKVLVISKYGLDVHSAVDLSLWLNGPFAQACGLETPPGKSPLFCLSAEEVDAYFRCLGRRSCLPTPYAKMRGARVDGGGEGWWWMADGRAWGTLGPSAQSPEATDICVRPAWWISL